MPTPGTYSQGSAAQIKFGSVDPPTTLIGGVKTGNYRIQRGTNRDDLYNQEASIISPGKAGRTWTVTGLASVGDTGLSLVKSSIDDDTGPTRYISGSLDGTNGESLPCTVSNLEVGFPDANRKCTYSFQVDQADDPSPIGTGILGEV
jgi:hypothetical protein